jgi:hypothetical protein
VPAAVENMCSLIDLTLLVKRTRTRNFVPGECFFALNSKHQFICHHRVTIDARSGERIGGHEQVPERSNCKGPSWATLCSHPWGRGHVALYSSGTVVAATRPRPKASAYFRSFFDRARFDLLMHSAVILREYLSGLGSIFDWANK